MNFILGKKLNMEMAFTEKDEAVSSTVIQAGPCIVTQVKDSKKEGYSAVQVGFGQKKKQNKPTTGHLKNLGNLRWLREFRVDKVDDFKKGQKLEVSQFVVGDIVRVSGISKGKGFQGVVKRHGFHGSPATHGHKDQLRMPGSIGATGPMKVFKGTKLPGRMGGNQATVKNLEVLAVDPANNLIKIKGAVPGARNGLLMIVKCGHRERATKEEDVKPKKASAKGGSASSGKDTKKPEAKETKPADKK